MRLIDADALIKQIEKNICEPCRKRKDDHYGVRCRACRYGDEMDDIEDAPTIEPQKWIPCSERLPEVNGRYLVTRGLNACGSLWNRIYIANYSDLMGIKSERIWWQGNVGKPDFERLDDVIAWMPLPTPWKE